MTDFYDPFDVDHLPGTGAPPPDVYWTFKGSPYFGVWDFLDPWGTYELVFTDRQGDKGALRSGGGGFGAGPWAADFQEIIGNPHFTRSNGDMAVNFVMSAPTEVTGQQRQGPCFGLGVTDPVGPPGHGSRGPLAYGQVQFNFLGARDDGTVDYEIRASTGLSNTDEGSLFRTLDDANMWLVLRVRSGHATLEVYDADPSVAGHSALLTLDAPSIDNTGCPFLYVYYPAQWTDGPGRPPPMFWFSEWKWQDDLLTGPGHGGGGVTPSAPTNTVAPVVSGTAAVGQVLTADNGTWDNNPTSFAYQWYRDADMIVGATANTYVVANADAGHDLSCDVSATNANGSNSAPSNTITIAGTPPDPIAGAAISVGRETTGIVRLG